MRIRNPDFIATCCNISSVITNENAFPVDSVVRKPTAPRAVCTAYNCNLKTLSVSEDVCLCIFCTYLICAAVNVT